MKKILFIALVFISAKCEAQEAHDNGVEINEGIRLVPGDSSGFETTSGALYYNQTSNKFRFNQGGTWVGLGGSGISSLVEDTSPQLGGNLDFNGFGIGTLIITDTEVGYLNNVTSNIQTQLNQKVGLLSATYTLGSGSWTLRQATANNMNFVSAGGGDINLTNSNASGSININNSGTRNDSSAVNEKRLQEVVATSGGIDNVVEDLTPQLGGNLDVNGNTINAVTFTGDISVPDEVYGVGWNASVEVPTKNALYDKIETISQDFWPLSGDFPTTGNQTITTGGNLIFRIPSAGNFEIEEKLPGPPVYFNRLVIAADEGTINANSTARFSITDTEATIKTNISDSTTIILSGGLDLKIVGNNQANVFSFKDGSNNLIKLKAAEPTETNNVTTKNYADTNLRGVSLPTISSQAGNSIRINGTEDGWEYYTPGSGAVSSVFTRTGAVVAQSGDYTAAQVTNAFDKTADDAADVPYTPTTTGDWSGTDPDDVGQALDSLAKWIGVRTFFDSGSGSSSFDIDLDFIPDNTVTTIEAHAIAIRSDNGAGAVYKGLITARRTTGNLVPIEKIDISISSEDVNFGLNITGINPDQYVMRSSISDGSTWTTYVWFKVRRISN